MRTYHIGLIKGTGPGLWNNGHRKSTLIVQARRYIDFLSPELWRYEGEHETTKTRLRQNKAALLTWVNGYYGTAFTHIIID